MTIMGQLGLRAPYLRSWLHEAFCSLFTQFGNMYVLGPTGPTGSWGILEFGNGRGIHFLVHTMEAPWKKGF